MSEEKPKIRQISLKLSEDEYEAISEAAGKTYRSLCAFIQYAAVTEANRENEKQCGNSATEKPRESA